MPVVDVAPAPSAVFVRRPGVPGDLIEQAVPLSPAVVAVAVEARRSQNVTSVAVAGEAVVKALASAGRDPWTVGVTAGAGAMGAVVRDTSRALAARDLVGSHGFSARQYDVLTLAWRLTVGQIHRDDKPVT